MASKFLKVIMLCVYGWLNNCYADNLQAWAYEPLVNRVTTEIVNDLRNSLYLMPSGTGGSMPYDVETISIYFLSKQSVDINEARRIAVLAIDRFKKKVNACQKLRPYLREYPFPNGGAEISLSFPKDPQRNPTEGVDRVLHLRGNLNYFRHSDPQPDRRAFYKEPYEEALAIVQKKYPADFPPSQEEDRPAISLSFTDTRDLPFDRRAESKKAELIESFIVPIQELNELAILGLQATHSKNLSAILRDLTRNIVDPYFDEAFLQRVHDFQLAHPDGEYIEYWGNGQMKFRGYFKGGVPDQHFHGWYSTGHDAFKGFFENGKPAGIHMAFFPYFFREGTNPNAEINPKTAQSFTGRLLSYNKSISVIPYIDGLLDGHIELYQQGQLIAERQYKKGQLVMPKKTSS